MKKSKTSFFKTSLFSYLLFLIFLSLGAFLLGLFVNSDGSGSGEFVHYSGPVLPMTSLSGAEGVEVSRNVNFDFSPYQTHDAYHPAGKGAAEITDSYVLTNTSGETKTLELAYAFLGSFNDQVEEFSVITVGGVMIQPELYPAIDKEEKVYYSDNFKKYSRTLKENDFLGIATQQIEALDIPVTAYHFTDFAYNGTVSALNPMLTLRCSLDENTVVWATGLTKFESEKDGRQLMMFSVDQDEAWMFTAGGTLIDPEFGGNKSWYIEKNSAIDGVTFSLETYETTLSEALLECAGNWNYLDSDAGIMTPELLTEYRKLLQLVGNIVRKMLQHI